MLLLCSFYVLGIYGNVLGTIKQEYELIYTAHTALEMTYAHQVWDDFVLHSNEFQYSYAILNIFRSRG